MICVKEAEGKVYDAARHSHVYGLQKVIEGQDSARTTVCYSYFQPNGGAELSASDKERIYYLVKGSMTVRNNNEIHQLVAGDLILINAGEEREVIITGGKPAEVLVLIVTP